MSVILIENTVSGYDAFNAPIYTETEIIVPDVLVAQPQSDDLISTTDLQGKKIAYVLGIPKGDAHNWQDKKVKFFGRTFKTYGFPIEGIESNVPTRWHKKVMVEYYE